MKKLLLLLFVSGSALADDAAVLRCRQVSDAPQRLSCYDAMPVRAPAAVAPVQPGAAVPMRPAAAVSTQPAAEKQAREESFGLNKTARVDSIESMIHGRFDGWSARQKITLANGQVWVVSDGSDGVMSATNPKVVVTRGVFGAMYMEVEGLRKAFRVQRLQ